LCPSSLLASAFAVFRSLPSRIFFMPLFTEVPGNGVLGSSYPRSCIDRPSEPRGGRLSAFAAGRGAFLDTTLIPAIVRVRASRKGLFAGQATFGRCVSKTEWVYGFKVALSVTPEGVIAAFGLAVANSDERPIGEFLLTSDGHDAFLADTGFSSVAWEKHWLEEHGALVAATPQKSARRAWPEAVCR
jgi:hypothetical protein